MEAIVTIRMLHSVPGAPDGVTVQQYEKGRTYDVPRAFADALCDTKESYAVRTTRNKVTSRKIK